MVLHHEKYEIRLDDKVRREYTHRLEAHIEAVQEAGRMLGVNETQLQEHDRSKWSPEEFGPYALHFCGGGAPDLFYLAWLHHIHHNPHHWQYWIFPDGFTPKGTNVEDGVVPMPGSYALEMVADWMGASKVYTSSWDMADWLTKNKPRIIVHSQTGMFLDEILDMQGYADVIHTREWGKINK